MTAIFKMFGNGDAMTGMTYMTYGFVGIILIVIIISIIMITRNSIDDRKKDSVSLKSKTAEKKAEQLKKGLFNYDIIDGEDKSLGLDPTDPANQKRNMKHHNANTPHKGLKPANLNALKKNTPKVELKKSESPSTQPVMQTNANTTASTTITEPPAPTTTGTRIFTDTENDVNAPIMITNPTQSSSVNDNNDYNMSSFTDDNDMQLESQSAQPAMAPAQMQAPGVQMQASNQVQSVQHVQQSVPQYESQARNVKSSIPDNPFAMSINPDSFMKNN